MHLREITLSCIDSFSIFLCSQFPPLTCSEERQRYKQTFNIGYDQYLKLKETIDDVANKYQEGCSALSERLDSVPKQSPAYKVLYCFRLIMRSYLITN